MVVDLKRAAGPNRRTEIPEPADQDLNYLSHLLDDFITIPGTRIRLGLDGIIGFVPGIGDILAGLASTIIIVAAWKRGVPKIVVARMVVNVAIETVVGALPVIGNLFDIAWRANRRNYKLLEASRRESGQNPVRSWLFIIALCIVLALLMSVPFILADSVFDWVRYALANPSR